MKCQCITPENSSPIRLFSVANIFLGLTDLNKTINGKIKRGRASHKILEGKFARKQRQPAGAHQGPEKDIDEGTSAGERVAGAKMGGVP